MSLPAAVEDFSSAAYWSHFHAERGGRAFDWYGRLAEFGANVRALGLPPTARVLVLGCGNSTLSADLHRECGLRDIISVDFDAGVIDEMRRKSTKLPSLRWQVADVRELPFAAASFDAIVDKGTLDAMMTRESDAEVAESVRRMFQEVRRVLAPGGSYLVATLAQEHLLRYYLQCNVPQLPPPAASAAAGASPALAAYDWLCVAPYAAPDYSSARCPFVLVAHASTGAVAAPGAAAVHVLQRPPFVSRASLAAYVATLPRGGGSGAKGGAGAGATAADLTAASYHDAWCRAVAGKGSGSAGGSPDGGDASRAWLAAVPSGDTAATVEVAVAAVRECQWAYDVERVTIAVAPGNRLVLDAWAVGSSAGDAAGGAGGGATSVRPLLVAPGGSAAPAGVSGTTPRFTLTMVDASLAPTAAVVLVPQGREHEWAFSSREGQLRLAQSSVRCGRSIFVALNRGHTFTSQRAVQEELSPLVSQLLPKVLRDAGGSAKAVPFMAVADDIGHRVTVATVTSTLSGRFIVEDVDADDSGDEVAGAAADTQGKGGRGVSKPTAVTALRRLIFDSNRNAIQTEQRVRLVRAPGGGAVSSVSHDIASLRLEYQRAMVAGLALLGGPAITTVAAAAATAPSLRLPVLVLGLGGGTLPTFLATAWPWMAVHAVELDVAVADAAAAYFAAPLTPVAAEGGGGGGGAALPPPGRIGLVVGDGLAVVQQLAAPASGAAEAATTAVTASAGSPAAASAEAAADPPASAATSASAATAAAAAGSTAAAAAPASAGSPTPTPAAAAAAASPPRVAAPRVLIVDVDAKEAGSPLSFPPRAFVGRPFLTNARAAIAASFDGRPADGCPGLLLVNVACRVPAVLAAVVAAVRRDFGDGNVATVVVDEEECANTLVMALVPPPATAAAASATAAIAARGEGVAALAASVAPGETAAAIRSTLARCADEYAATFKVAA